MVSYYDELEIEDFAWDDVAKVFHYPCPCGDRFEISKSQLKNGEEIATCPSCSLIVRVIYDQLDYEDYESEDDEGEDEDASEDEDVFESADEGEAETEATKLAKATEANEGSSSSPPGLSNSSSPLEEPIPPATPTSEAQALALADRLSAVDLGAAHDEPKSGSK